MSSSIDGMLPVPSLSSLTKSKKKKKSAGDDDEEGKAQNWMRGSRSSSVMNG